MITANSVPAPPVATKPAHVNTALLAAAPDGQATGPASGNPFANLAPGAPLDRRRHWSVFRALNYFRLILIALLLLVLLFDENGLFLRIDNPELFKATTFFYIFIVLLGLIASTFRRPGLLFQVQFQAFTDIIVLGLLASASGGLSSNLMVLLIVAIAASGILMPLGQLLLTTLFACAALLTLGVYPLWPQLHPFLAANFTGLGDLPALSGFLFAELSPELSRIIVLLAALLVSSLLIYTLAERTRRSEHLATQRAAAMLELASLNQSIVQHLQSGIVVVDRLARITLINEAARELLDYREPIDETPLNVISPALGQRLANWVSTGLNNARPFRQADHLPDTLPVFSHLSENPENADTLIFLEDSSQIDQRVQRVKLAALGRLTASIAHEIRNPLASIDHAAQLLQESATASSGDVRLGAIIHENAQRASRIIANILDLSRRERAKPEDFELRPWLETFCKEFLRAGRRPQPEIELRVQPKDLTVRFDKVHLHQVLWNLVSNACLHGVSGDGETPRVKLHVKVDPNTHRPNFDVIDSGPGIDEEGQKQIFEPFFTTKSTGTGLGLYIAREICEANRGQLRYLRAAGGGSCFQIVFAPVITSKAGLGAKAGPSIKADQGAKTGLSLKVKG